MPIDLIGSGMGARDYSPLAPKKQEPAGMDGILMFRWVGWGVLFCLRVVARLVFVVVSCASARQLSDLSLIHSSLPHTQHTRHSILAREQLAARVRASWDGLVSLLLLAARWWLHVSDRMRCCFSLQRVSSSVPNAVFSAAQKIIPSPNSCTWLVVADCLSTGSALEGPWHGHSRRRRHTVEEVLLGGQSAHVTRLPSFLPGVMVNRVV